MEEAQGRSARAHKVRAGGRGWLTCTCTGWAVTVACARSSLPTPAMLLQGKATGCCGQECLPGEVSLHEQQHRFDAQWTIVPADGASVFAVCLHLLSFCALHERTATRAHHMQLWHAHLVHMASAPQSPCTWHTRHKPTPAVALLSLSLICNPHPIHSLAQCHT